MKHQPKYLIWFLKSNGYGLPEDLIIKCKNIEDVTSEDNFDEEMTEEEIEAHCIKVHENLYQWVRPVYEFTGEVIKPLNKSIVYNEF